MFERSKKYQQSIVEQSWLYPSVMSFVLVVVLSLLVLIDLSLPNFMRDEYQLYYIDIAGMRPILTVIATISMSITGVVFSVSVLTLSIASNQLGHKLLPMFIRQGRTQFILGIFVSLFVYSILLMVLSSTQYFLGKPLFLSFYMAVVYSIVAFFALIYFIHYVCKIIQAHHVLDIITKESIETITNQSVERDGKTKLTYVKVKNFAQQGVDIKAPASGFVQIIDYNGLKSFATENNISIKIHCKPGDYLVSNSVIGTVYSCSGDSQSIGKKISDAIFIDIHRCNIQDCLYNIEQIAEIALKALSPGVNNQQLAFVCINNYSRIFQYLSTRNMHSGLMYDDQQILRVKYQPQTENSIITDAFDLIIKSGNLNYCVIEKLLAAIKSIMLVSEHEIINAALQDIADDLLERSQVISMPESDRRKIKAHFDQILQAGDHPKE